MLNLIKNVIDVLLADSTIKSYVGTRIYPQGVDLFENKKGFPAITIHTISDITRSVPKVRDSTIQISIWSIKGQLEVENIAERILTLLNYQQTSISSSLLHWQREDGGVSLFESDRRIWHYALTFKAWATP